MKKKFKARAVLSTHGKYAIEYAHYWLFPVWKVLQVWCDFGEQSNLSGWTAELLPKKEAKELAASFTTIQEIDQWKIRQDYKRENCLRARERYLKKNEPYTSKEIHPAFDEIRLQRRINDLGDRVHQFMTTMDNLPPLIKLPQMSYYRGVDAGEEEDKLIVFAITEKPDEGEPILKILQGVRKREDYEQQIIDISAHYEVTALKEFNRPSRNGTKH